jgi:2-polyprenyl-3-methyl-5-hydroxy-6-metoxy-1,4-benzoquinol methylase
MLRPVSKKDISEIAAEWDALAPLRFRQISSGDDISYNRVIVPEMLSMLCPLEPSRVLDAGCGTGLFTARLSQMAHEVVGVDPSRESIQIARGLGVVGAKFFPTTIEDFSSSPHSSFDVVVANMVLMDVLCLGSFLAACRRLLIPSGALVFSMTHPCFWPQYYGYASKPWFRYQEEIIIEAPFRITADRRGSLVSTHIHRPLSCYVASLVQAGFSLRELREPTPPSDVDASYRRLWKGPRYVVGLAVAAQDGKGAS